MLRAITIMSGIGVAGIVAVEALRPKEDNAQIIFTILGFLSPTMVAVLALLKAHENREAVKDLHSATELWTDEILKKVKEGIDKERDIIHRLKDKE
jgi:hypothetical protein